MQHDLVYADPPWSSIREVWSDKGRGRSQENHYPTLTMQELCDLPVADLLAPRARLCLWAKSNNVFRVAPLITDWGFKLETAHIGMVWVKTNKDGVTLSMGLGKTTRRNAEYLIFASRGGGLPVQDHSILDVQIITRHGLAHSQKPWQFRKLIADMFAPQAALELFARRPYAGWTCLGNEIDSLDIREAISRRLEGGPYSG